MLEQFLTVGATSVLQHLRQIKALNPSLALFWFIFMNTKLDEKKERTTQIGSSAWWGGVHLLEGLVGAELKQFLVV